MEKSLLFKTFLVAHQKTMSHEVFLRLSDNAVKTTKCLFFLFQKASTTCHGEKKIESLMQ